jgi:hypothetical protein
MSRGRKQPDGTQALRDGGMTRRITLVLLVVALFALGGCRNTPDEFDLARIVVEPEAGAYLHGCEGAGTYDWGYDAGQRTNIMLSDIDLSIRPCEMEYSTHWVSHDIDIEVGEPCLVVSGHVESREDEKREVGMFAWGFDEGGQLVAETLDSNSSYGCILFDMEPGQNCEFLIHINPSDEIRAIRVFGSAYKADPSEPSTPVPESEMARITFSLEWLMENDVAPDDDTVTITFPASWLREPPEIPEEDETVELAVPMRLLMDHNESDDPDEITVTFPDYYFDGL